MSRRISQKWRPSLALILGLTVAAVLALPIAGILASRIVGSRIGFFEAQLIFGAIIVLLAGLMGWVLWRILYGPIRALSARAEGIKRGTEDALEPMEHYGTQEMHALGQSMLDMGRVLQGREAVLRSYADHATHELKSPLTVVRGAAELLAEGGLSPEDQTRMIARIESAAGRMAKLLDAQRALARAQEPLGEGVAQISDALASLRPEHKELEIRLVSDGNLPLPVEQLRLVLGHLLGNAAAHGATQVTFRATSRTLEVADNGPGVSDGNRSRVFDPFFTTRREAGGTGMGLAIVRRMLEAHGGQIALASEGPGARFVITF